MAKINISDLTISQLKELPEQELAGISGGLSLGLGIQGHVHFKFSLQPKGLESDLNAWGTYGSQMTLGLGSGLGLGLKTSGNNGHHHFNVNLTWGSD